VEDWPWLVRIYTLGRFSLVRNDVEVAFTGRAQARPLLMLKAIVALGGRGVRATELYDRLWPDSDGDAALGAFNTTLHRLRKLLGSDEAIELSDGLVSLNPRLVWVDIWVFERLLGQADGEIKASRRKPGGRLIDRALRLYQGPFMATDRDLPLYLPMAERLRSKFLRYIGRLGRMYDGAGEFERAIERFKRGIEVDVLAEEFYLGLMLSYKRLGRRAEAVGVYKRLEKTLSVMLGVEPSPESRALYDELAGRGR
jgi:DNA-binding SARP family transcriptional activator